MDDRFLSCGNNAISLEVEAELVMDRGLLINASGSESLLLVTFYDPSNPDLGEIWAGNDDDDIPCRLAVRDYGSPVFNILTTGAIDSGGSWQKLIEIPFSHQFVCAEFLIQTIAFKPEWIPAATEFWQFFSGGQHCGQGRLSGIGGIVWQLGMGAPLVSCPFYRSSSVAGELKGSGTGVLDSKEESI